MGGKRLHSLSDLHMRRFLSFFFACAILPIAHTSCPDGFELAAGGQCNKLIESSIWLLLNEATETAISKCKGLQAECVNIHNQEQQSYWAGRVSGAGVILGLVCNASTSKWEWSDGSTVDYKPPSYNSNLNENCKNGTNGCTWYIDRSSGYWQYSVLETLISTALLNFTQNRIKLVTIPVNSSKMIMKMESVIKLVGTSAENWNDAQLICRKLGANLASIHNQQENSFVRRLAVAKGAVTGLFLGATVSGKGGDFGWIDGTKWDYQNFYPGFPIPGFGDCIVMDTSTSTGQWMNTACSAKYPVACVREHRVITEPTCNSGPFKEGQIITSPGFPYSASTPCDFYLMVDEEKQVEVEVNLLEANSCCDSLILYDGYVGGIVLANLTGEIHNATFTTTSSNIMHVSWQPKGAVNVLGMALTFRGV